MTASTIISLFFPSSSTHTYTHTLTHTHTNSTGGVAMVNNQPMSVPGRMVGNPAAAPGYNMMESGVQPVRTVPNPSYPNPRPPGAPQVKKNVWALYVYILEKGSLHLVYHTHCTTLCIFLCIWPCSSKQGHLGSLLVFSLSLFPPFLFGYRILN